MMVIIENFDGLLLGNKGINLMIFSFLFMFLRHWTKNQFLLVMALLSFKTRKLQNLISLNILMLTMKHVLDTHTRHVERSNDLRKYK